jgi:hypothetical protein
MRHRNLSDDVLQKHLQGDTSDEVNVDDASDTLIGDNQVFTIIAEAQLDQEASASIETVVRRQSDDPALPPFEILDWKPHRQGVSLFDDAMDQNIINIENEFRYDDKP